MQPGQLADSSSRFCPYGAVAKYPYKHLHGEVSRAASDNYFARGLFQSRGWTIYYVRTLLDTAEKPLMLIPEEEVTGLFNQISQELEVHVTYPDIAREPGFSLTFEGEGTPRPRYLGKLSSECTMADLEQCIPQEGSPAEEVEHLEERSFPLFRRMMLDALQATRNKTKAVKNEKRRQRVDVKRKRCAELKRAQCYLGLRRRGNVLPENFSLDPNLTHDEALKAQHDHEAAAGIRLPPLDLTAAAPFVFDRNCVFVCIDIEVYERDHRSVTEIGVCTLDTLDLINVAPGKRAENWLKLLRSRHFRIVENAHMFNSEFVSGCADKFEFGTSEWISIAKAPQVLASCFKVPFSEPGKYQRHQDSASKVPRGGGVIQLPMKADEARRNIILVGHDISSDVGYMRNIGYDVGNLPNVLEAIDTTNLFRAFQHEQNPRNLGAVLLELELEGWHLHNAGNDATYTMQAMLGICVSALSPDSKPATEPTVEQITEAATEAENRLREEMDEWKIADEDGGDGGDPVALLPAVEAMANAQFDRAMKLGRRADDKREQKNFQSRNRINRSMRDRGNATSYENARPGRQPSKLMTLDTVAMDEAMGLPVESAANHDGPSDGGTQASTSTATGGEGLASERDRPKFARAGYIPPHLRAEQRAEAQPGGTDVRSNKLTARLRMLDEDD